MTVQGDRRLKIVADHLLTGARVFVGVTDPLDATVETPSRYATGSWPPPG
ncbi:hypothetical protein OG399_17770 [Streptomyces achromogenes]